MSLRRHSPLLLGLVLAILISLFPFNTIIAQSTGDPLIEVPGSVSPELGNPAPLPPGLTKVDLYRVAVTLRPRNEAAYAALAVAVQDVSSSFYRHFITDAEYARDFAPTQQSIDNLKKYLTGQGLTVSYESADRLLLTVEGTISQLDKAFNTTSEYHTNSKGQSGYINVTSLQLPTSLVSGIVGVTGFDNLHTPHVNSVHLPLGGGSDITTSTPISTSNTPTSMRTAYGIAGSGYTGAGATVAITLWGAPNQTDLARWQTNQDPGHPITLTIATGSSTPTTDDGLRFEANMDVQMVHVGAYNASIRFYNAPTATFADLQSALSSAVNDNVNALTSSWGGCESGISSGTRNSYHTVFQSAATKGIPVFFSSGDSGVFECNSGTVSNVGFSQFPAGDDLVTSVGGTLLSRDGTTSAWFNEGGWSCSNPASDITCLQSQGGSSTGGKTVNITRPTYQNSITPPTEAKFNNAASNTRLQPDLSMDGAPASGIIIYGSFPSFGCSDNCTGGGTSASSPLMAGSLAQAFERKGSQVGGINSFIYTNFSGASWGFDVISGYNGVTDKVGWDYVTGLGSLKNVGTFVTSFVSLCDTVVTKITDDGSCGTLRAAVSSANTGVTKTVTFNLSLPTTITLTGSGLMVGPGVTVGSLATTCGVGGPKVTIIGQGVVGDGFTLSSSSLVGLYIRQFGGRQIVTAAPGNGLACVKATKT